MNKKKILTALAVLTGFGCLQAQEYINISGPEHSFTIPLEEIDSITIGETTRSLSTQLANDPRASIYSAALVATGLDNVLNDSIYDFSYDANTLNYFYYYNTIEREVATAPDSKKQSYTLFVTPDEVLNKYGIHSLEDLYHKACALYDPLYPEDQNQPWHAFEQLTDERNPLNRYMRYTILNCDVRDLNRLTGLILNQGVVKTLGIKTDLVNPTDWYQTLLPHTLMKCEQLTVENYVGKGTLGEYYINRRYDKAVQVEGTAISRTLPETTAEAPNGRYFYVDDLVAYTTEVRDVVQNTRIRMDFSTVFPELVSQGIRLNGDPTQSENSNSFNNLDLTFPYGRNFYFPKGYLDGLTLNEVDQTLVYKRPQWSFWNYQGDEFNLFGKYDFEFRLPPVPFSGEWQIRLGLCALLTRGKAKISLNGEEQADTIDFTLQLNDKSILGVNERNFPIMNTYSYFELSEEGKAAEQAALKAKGYYRAPFSSYYTDGVQRHEMIDNPMLYRRVIYQGVIEAGRENILRIRNINNSLNAEFQLDYIELVPKTVYDSAEEPEDNL